MEAAKLGRNACVEALTEAGADSEAVDRVRRRTQPRRLQSVALQQRRPDVTFASPSTFAHLVRCP